MDIKNQPKLRFLGVNILKVDFNVINFYDGKASISLDVVPKLFVDKPSASRFKILMSVKMSCDNFFNLSLDVLGEFHIVDLNEGDDEDFIRKSFINANAPAIMFPYVRAFVSTFTSNIGDVTGRLVLPVQHFSGDLEEIDLKDFEQEKGSNSSNKQ